MERIYQSFSKIILSAFILLMSHACIDLDEDTSSILLIENLKSEADVTAALTSIYREYATLYLNPPRLQIMACGSDDITTDWGTNKAPIRFFDRFDYGDGENADNIWLPTSWNTYWQVVYYANRLIDGMKTSTAPEKVIALGNAEARCFRAMAYLNLVKGWGNMPIILDGQTPTGEEIRATVLENYNTIEADLKIAEATLPGPGVVANTGRVSSAFAKTLLADLYLTWAGWPVKDVSKYTLAAAKAKEIIDMNYFSLLPIDKLWLLENQNSRESVFAFQASEAELIRSFWTAAFTLRESRGASDFFPEKQFFNDFPEGARKIATFEVNIPQRSVKGGKIVDNTPLIWTKTAQKHPGYKKFTMATNMLLGLWNNVTGFRAVEVYRYAEILLIYAEASARANGGIATPEAIEAFNQIKRRAAGLIYNQAASSVDVPSATADEIFVEKGWELAGEGKRWYDLVRMEKVAEVTARRDPTEEVVLAKSASAITWKQYIAPIPFSTISTSKLMQNPEGFKAIE